MQLLDVHSTSEAFEDNFERFEIWAMTKEDIEDVNIAAHFLTFIGKEAYSLLKTLTLPEKPTSLSYAILEDLLLDYVKYTNFECSLRSCDVVHEDGDKFGQCLSCGRFHSLNSCKFLNSECFKCGDIGHIQSVCNTTVHLSATNIKSCNSDSIKSSVPNDHLSLSTISKDSVESYSSSELSETNNL
ncbi:unnamed protein product [Schistosoma curassoni]|uniref:CCHC-type domain-containing protein n=1 Tax=Schistosoma curassoni TaxID=6186 RepID=A0A183JTC8_9TREM|nr:unnamed protein product [Schistosoma curassoni]